MEWSRHAERVAGRRCQLASPLRNFLSSAARQGWSEAAARLGSAQTRSLRQKPAVCESQPMASAISASRPSGPSRCASCRLPGDLTGQWGGEGHFGEIEAGRPARHHQGTAAERSGGPLNKARGLRVANSESRHRCRPRRPASVGRLGHAVPVARDFAWGARSGLHRVPQSLLSTRTIHLASG